jgi:nitrogen fixation protein NifU and related proteins
VVRGGLVGGLDDLYQQLILDHYRNRRGRGRIAGASASVHEHNPVCGDECYLDILVEDGRIAGIMADGDGCSISQAAASMLTEVALGKELDDALALVEHFRLVMHGEAQADEDILGDAVALEGVARYPVRVKCALLSWLALRDCIAGYREMTATGG